MITIYANWTGEPVACGATLDEARHALSFLACGADTKFGDETHQMTALDTGAHDPTQDATGPSANLPTAVRHFPKVPASGYCRPGL